MTKVTYVNPLDDTVIVDFKPVYKFLREPYIEVTGKYKKTNALEDPKEKSYLENLNDGENIFFIPELRFFGEVKKYLLNKNTIEKLEIFNEEEKKEKSVFKRAIVGGILTGGIGAIVGGVSALKTDYRGIRRIVINDKIEFKINDKNFKKVAKFFIMIIEELEQRENNKEIKTDENNNKEIKNNENIIKKLKELKELLDLGIITQEEFDSKKVELMKKI